MSGTHVRTAELDGVRYLREQLGERGPAYLVLEGEFDEAPLEGEGRTLLFSFDVPPGPGLAESLCSEAYESRHYVVTGETTPNYFPAYGLSADDAYSFHVGTRFFLGMEVQRVDASLEPPGARDSMRIVVAQHTCGAHIESEELAGLFKCDADYFAVYRLCIRGGEVYFLGADCPPGFYQLTKFPPQTALRLHLGKLIRAEARQSADSRGP
jgi:hypothetical protein